MVHHQRARKSLQFVEEPGTRENIRRGMEYNGMEYRKDFRKFNSVGWGKRDIGYRYTEMKRQKFLKRKECDDEAGSFSGPDSGDVWSRNYQELQEKSERKMSEQTRRRER